MHCNVSTTLFTTTLSLMVHIMESGTFPFHFCPIQCTVVQWWFWQQDDPILYVYERVILCCRQFVFVSEIICICACDLNKWSPAWIAVSGSLSCHQMDIIALSPLQCCYTHHHRTNTQIQIQKYKYTNKCHQMDIIALSPLQYIYTHNRTNAKQCLSTKCKEMYSWFVQNVLVTYSSQ